MRKRRRFTSWFADQHTIHGLKLWVYMYKVHHGSQQSCRCLEDEERNCKWLVLLPGIVPILYDSLLNHMTIITKVGVSYVDHTNDDGLEVDNFSRGCYQPLSSPHFWGESLGMRPSKANPLPKSLGTRLWFHCMCTNKAKKQSGLLFIFQRSQERRLQLHLSV